MTVCLWCLSVQFNLDVDEIEYVRALMEPWKKNVHQQLQIDIFWDSEPHSQHKLIQNMVR